MRNKRELFEERLRIFAFRFEQHIQNSSFLYHLENSKTSNCRQTVDIILTPVSTFVGHYLKDVCNKFNTLVFNSFSLVKILEQEQFDPDSFLCIVDFKSLYTNIPVQHAIESMKE